MEKEKKPFYQKGIYALTINPSDANQYNTTRNRMLDFRSYIHSKLLSFKMHGIMYKLRIEISEGQYTKEGDKTYISLGNKPHTRLHCHGSLQFRSNESVKWFLLRGINLLVDGCSIKIGSITDLKEWKRYCDKQHNIINEPYLTNLDTVNSLEHIEYELQESDDDLDLGTKD